MNKPTPEIATKKDLLARLKIMNVSGEERKKIVCVLIGHSKIATNCFGYKYCSRCGDQIGDSLGGVFYGKDKVVVGHGCPTCRKNYANLTWKDKYLAHPKPLDRAALAKAGKEKKG